MKEPRLEENRLIPAPVFRAGLSALGRVASVFVKAGFAPNTVTVLSFFAGLGGGALFALDLPLAAWVAVCLSGTLDVIDGGIAARTNRKTRFGAMLDSSLDRYSEFFIFAGLAYHFRGRWVAALAWIAFFGAMMVSYTRARAEGLGLESRVGFMQRPERIVVLATGAFFGAVFRVFDVVMTVALGAIALLSHATAVQRLAYVRRAENKNREKG